MPIPDVVGGDLVRGKSFGSMPMATCLEIYVMTSALRMLYT